MLLEKLPRFVVNWIEQPELVRRYWDLAMTAIESTSTRSVKVSELSGSPKIFRAIVSDATSTTFNSIVSGGGSNVVPVFFDGTNWRIG